MSEPDAAGPDADRAWQAMARYVMDHRDTWRRAVIERTGLPFGRIRVLRRLEHGPLTVSQLADAASIDRPAATVAVSALAEQGLVRREIEPHNRRCKLVSLTDDGRQLLAEVFQIHDPAPPEVAGLSARDLATLTRILGKLR